MFSPITLYLRDERRLNGKMINHKPFDKICSLDFFIFFIQKFTTYKNLLYICNVLLTSFPNVIGTYILKAFSGRFGFNVLESRKFKLSVKNKATRTPLSGVVNTNPLLVGLCIYIPWGFRCCSVIRQIGQCESLNTWTE